MFAAIIGFWWLCSAVVAATKILATVVGFVYGRRVVRNASRAAH